jgi:hypothetical protein
MQIIARNSRRLRRLVDTLLEIGRLGAGKLVATPIAVDLAAMTRGIAESFGPAVQRAGLEFVVECPPELSLRWGKIISRGGRAACTRRHRTAWRTAWRCSPDATGTARDSRERRDSALLMATRLAVKGSTAADRTAAPWTRHVQVLRRAGNRGDCFGPARGLATANISTRNSDPTARISATVLGRLTAEGRRSIDAPAPSRLQPMCRREPAPGRERHRRHAASR